jgi:hypothetical protein
MIWTPHILNASGSLSPWLGRLKDEADRAHDRLLQVLGPDVAMHPVDIVIDPTAYGTIPEQGIGGSCFRRDRIDVVLDPANPNFATSLESGEFRRTLYHEYHHALRWARVGYGMTLGEALVSEGLAEHFDCEVSGSAPQPWTQVGDSGEIAAIRARAMPDIEAPYDHAAWFFNSESLTLPASAGYKLGFALVGAYLAKHPEKRPSRLAGISASAIISGAG